MIEPHQRAALIPNSRGVLWHTFLRERFLGTSFGILIQSIEQQTQEHADLHGLVEHSFGRSLPVVSDFSGALNIETREITIHETQHDRHYAGQFSENGRVLTLRQQGEAKPLHLVHDETLRDLL